MQEIENSCYIFGQLLVLRNFTIRASVKFGFADMEQIYLTAYYIYEVMIQILIELPIII